MRVALADLERCARIQYWPVLLEGESGSGKSLFARRLHALRRGEDRPFQHVVLANIPSGIASSELFGHVAGAFTHAESNRTGKIVSAIGGTVFLDEIDKADPEVLMRLLHVVDRRELSALGTDRTVRVDVDFVAASNRSLAALVAEGKFPHDLLARFAHAIVEVPPLRQRHVDLPDIVRWYVARLAPRVRYSEPPRVSPALMVLLVRSAWPNNLRELESALALIMAEANGALELVPEHAVGRVAGALGRPARRAAPSDDEVLTAFEHALQHLPTAAAKLGINRSTMWRRLRSLGALKPNAEGSSASSKGLPLRDTGSEASA